MGSVTEIAPGLRRWTARHEEWNEEVASLAVATADGLVLIDPIAPPAALGPAAHVLLTVYWQAARLLRRMRRASGRRAARRGRFAAGMSA